MSHPLRVARFSSVEWLFIWNSQCCGPFSTCLSRITSLVSAYSVSRISNLKQQLGSIGRPPVLTTDPSGRSHTSCEATYQSAPATVGIVATFQGVLNPSERSLALHPPGLPPLKHVHSQAFWNPSLSELQAQSPQSVIRIL